MFAETEMLINYYILGWPRATVILSTPRDKRDISHTKIGKGTHANKL